LIDRFRWTVPRAKRAQVNLIELQIYVVPWLRHCLVFGVWRININFTAFFSSCSTIALITNPLSGKIVFVSVDLETLVGKSDGEGDR